MRYRAAAVVLALATAVAVAQVPMYSDYPWGLLWNGTDQGPVWNLNCRGGLWCHTEGYGNGVIELGDGGALPIRVSFADDAGQALLAGFAAYASDAGLADKSLRADYAADAGFANLANLAASANLASVATFALDAGQASRSLRSDYADDAGTAQFAWDAGFSLTSGTANFALDAGLAVAALWAGDAGYSASAAQAGLATYALDAGLANKATAADFARDAGSAASADLATYALDAGLAVAALYAGDAGLSVASLYAADAGLSAKALAADFARDAGSAASADVSTYALDAGLAVAALYAGDAGLSVAALYAADAGLSAKALAADFARDAGSAASADLSTYALDAGQLQCTGCITDTKLASNSVTTAKVADLAITYAELDDGISLAAYDEATPAGIFSRSTATNCTKPGSYDGTLAYVRFTIAAGATNPQVSTTLYTGTSTNQLTTRAVMRYRISGGAAGVIATLRAYNNADITQTASAVFLADSNWHTAVFDISGWTTAGTLRVDLGASPALGTTGYWDISYLGTGNPGSGTGALVSYQGSVGIGVPTPGDALEVLKAASSGWTAQFTNGSTAASTAKTVGVELRGTDTSGIEKQAALLRAVPEDNNYVAAGLSLSTRTGDAVAERVAISGSGIVTVNQPASGASLQAVGTSTPYMLVVNTSNAASTFPQYQAANYGANGGFPLLATYNSRGTLASPASLNSGDTLGAWLAYGRSTSAFVEGARMEAVLTAAPTTTLTAALRWYTANAGTSTARARLSAAGRLYIGGDADAEELLEVRSGSSAYGVLHSNGTIKLGTYISTEGQFGTKSNHDLALFTNNGVARVRITAAGETRVIALAGTGNRAVYSDANGTLTNTSSDGTLKTDVEELRAPLRMVLNLRPVSFTWKDTARFGPQREIGFIAQEVMQTIPEVVGRNSDGTYTVDYPKIVAALAGAVQELYEDRTWLARRAQELEDRAQRAEDRLAQLEERLAKLEAWVAE